MHYGLKITRRDGSSFLACGEEGTFNSFSRRGAVQFKVAAKVASPKRMKVVPLIIKEGK